MRLRQILVNLIGNAIKFTELGGVRVRVAADSTDLRIDVNDSGIGMDADQQARLFDAFAQGDSSTTRRFGGTGLGLAVAEGIVKEHDGVILARNRVSPLTGAEFAVVLPADTPSRAREPRGYDDDDDSTGAQEPPTSLRGAP